MVLERLVAAIRLVRSIGGRVGPRDFGPTWFLPTEDETLSPREIMEMSDDGSLAEYQARLEADRRRWKAAASALEVSKMEEALSWPGRFLDVPKDGEPLAGDLAVLRVYLRCKAERLRFDVAIRAQRWSRATAYRVRDRALARIASNLNRNRTPVR